MPEPNLASPAVPVFVRSNRELHTAQIHDCLASIASLTNCLRVAASSDSFGPDYETEQGKTKALDSNSRAALELSLGKACSRLDALLDDAARWNLPDTDSHTLAIKYFTQSIIAQQQINESTAIQIHSLQQRLDEEAGARRLILNASVQKSLAELAPRPGRKPSTAKPTLEEL